MGNNLSQGQYGSNSQPGFVPPIEIQNPSNVSCRQVENAIGGLNPQQGFLSYFRRTDPVEINQHRQAALVQLEEYSNYLSGIITQIQSSAVNSAAIEIPSVSPVAPVVSQIAPVVSPVVPVVDPVVDPLVGTDSGLVDEQIPGLAGGKKKKKSKKNNKKNKDLSSNKRITKINKKIKSLTPNSP